MLIPSWPPSPCRGLRQGVPAGIWPAEYRAAQVVAPHWSTPQHQCPGMLKMLRGTDYLMRWRRKKSIFFFKCLQLPIHGTSSSSSLVRGTLFALFFQDSFGTRGGVCLWADGVKNNWSLYRMSQLTLIVFPVAHSALICPVCLISWSRRVSCQVLMFSSELL